MPVRKEKLKTFWGGWMDMLVYPFTKRDYLWKNLAIVFCLPLYPLFWLGTLLYLKLKE